jgi:hypothetical protein
MKKSNFYSVSLLITVWFLALAPVHALDVNPTWHDFGEVSVGESAVTIITLTNTGFSQITISSITIVGSGDFSSESSIYLPFTLGYGESVDIVVTFTPSAAGDASAQLVITNDEQFIVPLQGTGVAQQPSPWECFRNFLIKLWNYFLSHINDDND